jgi:hypothetical protein
VRNYLARKALRFFAVAGVGLALAGLVWLATNVLGVRNPFVDTSPIEVRLIVAPAAANWVTEAAGRFDERWNSRPITIRVIEQDGLEVYTQLSSDSLRPAPSAWIAEGNFTLELANLAARLSSRQDAFAGEGAVARSVLMWGGFSDRIAAVDARFGGLTWSALREAAVAPNGWASLGGRPEWGFFKMVLPDPRKSSEGLAAVLSAAAEFHGKVDLAASDLSDTRFQQWAQALVDAVPNFANFGTEPGKALAVRGPSAGDAGLLLESDWVSALDGLSKWQPALRYAPAAVAFDFPFAVWVGLDATGSQGSSSQSGGDSRREAEQQAARLFRDFLLRDEQQRRAEAFGLRPASGNAVNGEGSLFAQWSALGVPAGLPATAPVKVSAEAVLAAFHWVEAAVGR